MRQSRLEMLVFALVVVASLAWLGGAWLGQALLLLLAWSVLSVAIVGLMGAWVALARKLGRWPRSGLYPPSHGH